MAVTTGALSGSGGPTPPIAGKYTVDEIYGELRVPIIQGQPMFEDLSVSGSYRHSSYSTDIDTNMVATSKVTVQGNTATGVTICHNPMVMPLPDGEQVFVCGLWYHDEYVRTDKGWRIAKRVEEKTYVKDMPAGLPGGD